MGNGCQAVVLAGGAGIDADTFRSAMRQLAGGICAITVGRGDERTGLTSTSVSSLSAEPPALVFCINKTASSWPILQARRAFAVNVLPPGHRSVADRFSGRNGVKGLDRYEGARWSELVTGTPVLLDALAVLDCEVEDLIERFGSAVVIGRVVAARVRGEDAEPEALTYWRGAYSVIRR
ncbi:flavin reductase family protein [Hyphomicrobium zavarzinii]|uniref:flavin reductase family protein n=1 Tax=Hyphomicrobium zavarzinii TaxID=48292 RepID=UPI000370F999|nr:flavin reductase family protein [Hyphomicrobium zavarzinii]